MHALLFDCADESVEKFWNVTEDVFMNKMERVKKPSHSSSPGLASDVSSDENESSRLFLDRLETLAKQDEDAKALFFLDAPWKIRENDCQIQYPEIRLSWSSNPESISDQTYDYGNEHNS